MARKFLTAIDLNKNELQNGVVQNLASAPGSPVAGQIYYNTTDDTYYGWDGTQWLDLGGTDAATLNGQAPSYYLARANHTGTQLASTISDFDTQVRTSRLDQMAAPTSNLSLNSQKLVSVADPTNAQDAATKAYVDATREGLDVKDSVVAATTAAGTLATDFENGDTLDGVTLATNDRILIKDQATASENGIYTVNATGAPTRAADFDSSDDVTPGAFVFVEEGTANADSGWVLTTDGAITVGTTSLAFAQFSGAGQITAGAGLTKSGNTLDVGAGNGITVNADTIETDNTVVVEKYSETIGDGVATSIAVTHNLGTRDVTVGVYLAASTYDEVECEIEHTDANNVTLKFATAPSTNELRVVVHG